MNTYLDQFVDIILQSTVFLSSFFIQILLVPNPSSKFTVYFPVIMLKTAQSFFLSYIRFSSLNTFSILIVS